MCNKIPYDTKQDAIKDRDLLMNNPRNTINKKQRPYPCCDCGKWHLTSSTPSVSRRYRRNYRKNKKVKNGEF